MNTALIGAIGIAVGALLAGGFQFLGTWMTARTSKATAAEQAKLQLALQQAQFQENTRNTAIERRRQICLQIYTWCCGFAEAIPRPGIIFGQTPEERTARVLEQLQPLMERHAEVLTQAHIELEDIDLIDAYTAVTNKYNIIRFGLALNKDAAQQPRSITSEPPYNSWVADIQALDQAVFRVQDAARRSLGLQPFPHPLSSTTPNN